MAPQTPRTARIFLYSVTRAVIINCPIAFSLTLSHCAHVCVCMCVPVSTHHDHSVTGQPVVQNPSEAYLKSRQTFCLIHTYPLRQKIPNKFDRWGDNIQNGASREHTHSHITATQSPVSRERGVDITPLLVLFHTNPSLCGYGPPPILGSPLFFSIMQLATHSYG